MDIRPNGLWSWNYIYIYVRNIMLIFIHHTLLSTIFRKKLTQANAHDAPFSICKVEVHTNHLPKPNTIKDLLIYFCLRVLKWLVAYLFEVCGVLIKFFFGSKKMTFQYSIYLSFKRYQNKYILKLHVIFQLLQDVEEALVRIVPILNILVLTVVLAMPEFAKLIVEFVRFVLI